MKNKQDKLILKHRGGLTVCAPPKTAHSSWLIADSLNDWCPFAHCQPIAVTMSYQLPAMS